MIRLAIANVTLCALGAVLVLVFTDAGPAPATAPKPPVWDASTPAHHIDEPDIDDPAETRR
jgi:hypothetical protein